MFWGYLGFAGFPGFWVWFSDFGCGRVCVLGCSVSQGFGFGVWADGVVLGVLVGAFWVTLSLHWVFGCGVLRIVGGLDW